jgi:hypothetical protein
VAIAKRWTGEGPEQALKHPKFTRRAVLAAGLGLAAAPPHATTRADEAPPENQAKISQAEAQYQNTPKGMFSCGVCTFFIKPTSCKVVAGTISPTGWCKLFDLPD